MTWADPLACDTETDLIAIGKLAPELVITATADSVTETTAVYAPRAPEVRDVLDSRCIVGANFAYDAGVFIADDPEMTEIVFDAYDQNRVRDVQIDQRLLDIADGCLDGYWDYSGEGKERWVPYTYSLDALTQRYEYPALDKNTWRLRYGEFKGLPLSDFPEGALQYPQDDCVATLRVHVDQVPTMYTDPAVFVTESCAQARAAFALHLMSCWGIRTDRAHADRIIRFITEAADRARGVCVAGGVVRTNGKRDMSAIRDRVLAAYAQRPILITATGNKLIGADPKRTVRLSLTEIKAKNLEKYVSTDGDVCTNSGDPVLEAVQMYGSAAARLKKVGTLRRGSYIPLQTRFDSLKETGRTSSKAPGPSMVGDNFQNFARASAYPRQDKDGWGLYATPTAKFRLAGPYPTRKEAQHVADSVDVRGCIIPEPGYVLDSLDINSAEAHTWAQVCKWAVGQSRMADTLNSGKDPHVLFGAEALLERAYDDVFAAYLKKDPEAVDVRQFSKVPNYGLPGMLGAETFVEYAAGYGYVISMERSEFVVGAWREFWDEAVPYFNWVKSHDDGSGKCWIEQFVSKRIRGRCSVPAASNSFFQGLAADAIKSSLLPIWRECMLGRTPEGKESPLLGTKPLLFAHDEVLAAHPIDVKHDAAMRMREIVVSHFNRYVPDCPASAEPALMWRYSKSAKAVYDTEGKLIVWE